VFAAWCLVFIPIIAIGLVVLPMRHIYRFSQLACRLAFFLIGVKVVGRGAEGWDPGQAYVVMGNHVNFLDPFVMACVFPRYMAAIEKRENFRIPFYGFLMKRWGNIPIDRSNRAEAMKAMQEAASVARADASWIVIMPEGTRTRTGLMGPFKKGGFLTAMASGLPIACYSLVGSWDVMSTGKDGWKIRPGTIEVVMHPPIDTTRYDRIEDLMGDVRRQIASALPGEPALPERVPTAV
jgi:1-acyl-sn-glycerol-3-phosphate acyltransferase